MVEDERVIEAMAIAMAGSDWFDGFQDSRKYWTRLARKALVAYRFATADDGK